MSVKYFKNITMQKSRVTPHFLYYAGNQPLLFFLFGFFFLHGLMLELICPPVLRHILPTYVMFSANSSLGNTLIMQKYSFVLIKLCYLWEFS